MIHFEGFLIFANPLFLLLIAFLCFALSIYLFISWINNKYENQPVFKFIISIFLFGNSIMLISISFYIIFFKLSGVDIKRVVEYGLVDQGVVSLIVERHRVKSYDSISYNDIRKLVLESRRLNNIKEKKEINKLILNQK